MKKLAAKKCIACDSNTSPVKGVALKKLQKELGGKWKVPKGHHLEKEFAFKDFRQALKFTNKVGELAEELQHHPDIYLAWGKVRITIWTHKIDGLTESDFILAAKIETRCNK